MKAGSRFSGSLTLLYQICDGFADGNCTLHNRRVVVVDRSNGGISEVGGHDDGGLWLEELWLCADCSVVRSHDVTANKSQ